MTRVTKSISKAENSNILQSTAKNNQQINGVRFRPLLRRPITSNRVNNVNSNSNRNGNNNNNFQRFRTQRAKSSVQYNTPGQRVQISFGQRGQNNNQQTQQQISNQSDKRLARNIARPFQNNNFFPQTQIKDSQFSDSKGSPKWELTVLLPEDNEATTVFDYDIVTEPSVETEEPLPEPQAEITTRRNYPKVRYTTTTTQAPTTSPTTTAAATTTTTTTAAPKLIRKPRPRTRRLYSGTTRRRFPRVKSNSIQQSESVILANGSEPKKFQKDSNRFTKPKLKDTNLDKTESTNTFASDEDIVTELPEDVFTTT